MTSKKVAIIGAGASGLLCSIFCAKKGLHVDIFEQNNKIGKKILVSGNGRCNITNTALHVEDYFSDNFGFVKDALDEFGFKKFEKFCSSIGLALDIKDDGRVYPLSNEAKSVASLLMNYAKNLGVTLHVETKITNIKKLLSNYNYVVVATGSEAAEHLGGNRDGLNFAQEFSHTIIPTYPSLVQFHLTSAIAHKMSGAKINGEVSLLINNKKDSTCRGDILFTNYGVSGFAILDISQKASAALIEYAKVDISVNLLPNFNAQKLSSHISNLSRFSIIDILCGLIPMKIANALIEELNLTPSTCSADLGTKQIKKIANQMLNWRFEVKDTHGFRHAEVAGGGVDTKEINSKTMESLKQNNLYFCGEVLDVLGRRGGYNFAWAWASAYVCAKDITK
jgi:hypothetical protein